MSKPGSEYSELENLWIGLAKKLRSEAAALVTRAEIYEEAASQLRTAIDREEKKAQQVSVEEQMKALERSRS